MKNFTNCRKTKTILYGIWFFATRQIRQHEIRDKKKVTTLQKKPGQFNNCKLWQSNFECVASVIIFEVTYLIFICCSFNHQGELVRSILFYPLMSKKICRYLNSKFVKTLVKNAQRSIRNHYICIFIRKLQKKTVNFLILVRSYDKMHIILDVTSLTFLDFLLIS